MFVHCVFFRLRDDLTAEGRREFDEGVRSLLDIETVRHGFVGAPADTHRPVVLRDYSCGLVVAFDDKAGHDFYQDDPVHDRFRNECSHLWEDVKIYDVQE